MPRQTGFQPDKGTIVGLAQRIKDACASLRLPTPGQISKDRWWASFELHHGLGRYRISVEFLGQIDSGSRKV